MRAVLVPSLCLVLLPTLCVAQQGPQSRPTSQPAGEKAAPRAVLPPLGAPAGQFGAALQLTEKHSLTQVKEQLPQLKDKPVLVEGIIEDVCAKKGCWMVVRSGKLTTRVRFKDYGFFVPRDAGGRRVLMEGVASEQTISEEVARHYAEESTDRSVDPEDIKGPQKILAFLATGCEVFGRSELPPNADPASPQVAAELLARVQAGQDAGKLKLPEDAGLQAALEGLRTLPGARTQEFGLCATLEGWLVFSDAGAKAFGSGYAVRTGDGQVKRF